ncbi:MAG: hypothetical protein AAFQ74_01555 [Cyanobacteria bacterium J06623_4]
MKSKIAQLMAVSCLVATAITLPTTVKAEVEAQSTFTLSTTSSEQVNAELNGIGCFWVPGYGCLSWN